MTTERRSTGKPASQSSTRSTPRPRSEAPRSSAARPREGGFTPRPRPEGGSSYPRREGPPRAGGFTPRPRPEGGSSYPRRDAPPRAGGYAPRPRPAGDRPSGPRAGGFDRPSGPRPSTNDRPRFDRPAEVPFPYERPHDDGPGPVDDGGDQTGAVNRSRPVYPQGAFVRWRRDGKASPAAGWSRPQGGSPRNSNSNGRDARDDRRSSAPMTATDGQSLPSDPREAALRILHAVDTRSAFSDRLLDGAHMRAGADPRDKALLHELVKGSLRWRGKLDLALDTRVHVGLANTQPWIRNILRLGAYQILFLDRVPMHAAVDESVKLAHKYAHPGAAGLVNSVLRRLAEERDTIQWPEGDDAADLAASGSHPLWIVERWLERFGPAQTRALLAADNRTVPTGLRANTLRNSRAELIELLAQEGVEARAGELSPDLVWVEGHHSPGALHCFREGLCTAQDESEALVGRVVAPQKNERILDLCAAPGGKSSHLAELLGDDGEVWALERDEHRVGTLRTTLERMGMTAVHVVHGDGRTYQFPMPFDRVLVDAPCSGMGVLARRADARWRKGPEVLAEMPPVQLDLLDAAALNVAPGGLLVYSVCSFEPEETDHVVARFMAGHPGWKIESVKGAVPDSVVTAEGFMRVLPHVHGCDGAFAVRLRKP